MKTDKRTNRINLHLNNKELEIFNNKASNYKQMSNMIRDAVAQFDDVATIRRINALNELSLKIKDFEHELKKQGGNLNQITKRANELIYAGELNQKYYETVFSPQLTILQELLTKIKEQQAIIFKRLMKM